MSFNIFYNYFITTFSNLICYIVQKGFTFYCQVSLLMVKQTLFGPLVCMCVALLFLFFCFNY